MRRGRGALARRAGRPRRSRVSDEELRAKFDAAFERHAKRPELGEFDLVRDVDREKASRVALAAAGFPGVVVRCRPARVVDAPSGEVVGRVRPPDAVDAARFKDADQADGGRVYTFSEICSMQFGRSGLERAFDDSLRGDPGRARRNGRRAPSVELAVVDGAPLVTSIRRDVQALAEDVVHEATGDAAAVVVDLADGGVVALASRSRDGFDHAVCALRPGSVFKLVTALALLEAGVSPDETVHCAKHGRLPGGRSYVCDEEHGDVAFTDAFAQSCNCYFETMAERVGVDAMLRACRELGLDANPTLHLAGSPCGLDPVWREGSVWRPADLAKIGIGQGKALVSPLQVAVAYGRVATGGRRLSPWLVDVERRSTADTDASIARFAPLIRDAARRCVTVGTGKDVPELDAVEAAGKSGTGDLRYSKDPRKAPNNAWFVAFAPASNPRYVAAVVYESVKDHGARAAGGPVARLLAEALK